MKIVLIYINNSILEFRIISKKLIASQTGTVEKGKLMKS
jgi:hypothetical protein